jgi:ribonucleoside-triphosphate reductase
MSEIKRQPVECYTRIVGYIRPIKQWNEGKKSEYADRIVFKNGGNNDTSN